MNLTSTIKKKANEIGFSKIGISEALYYKKDQQNLYNWISNKHHASMHWIERRKEERSNIKKYYLKSIYILKINN